MAAVQFKPEVVKQLIWNRLEHHLERGELAEHWDFISSLLPLHKVHQEAIILICKELKQHAQTAEFLELEGGSADYWWLYFFFGSILKINDTFTVIINKLDEEHKERLKKVIDGSVRHFNFLSGNTMNIASQVASHNTSSGNVSITGHMIVEYSSKWKGIVVLAAIIAIVAMFFVQSVTTVSVWSSIAGALSSVAGGVKTGVSYCAFGTWCAKHTKIIQYSVLGLDHLWEECSVV
ncbi:hypothetical protein QOT17_022447 [Balamuthia mandrillaris]